MVDRPPVKLNARLPEGTLNGLGVILPDALDDDFDRLYFLAEAICPKTEHDKESGLDSALLRISAIEVLPDGKIPLDLGTAAEVLHALRSERVGDNPIDFTGASDADEAKLADLRGQLAEHAAVEGMGDAELAADVHATVPDAGPDWRADARILGEYLRVKGHIADPPAGSTAQLASVPAGGD